MQANQLTWHNERVRNMSSRRAVWIAALTGVLFVVWPIPHTIALRNAVMGLLLIALASGSDWRAAQDFVRGPARMFAVVYCLFTAWILVVAFFISPFPQWSLSEIEGQWLMGTGALILGALTAFQKNREVPYLAMKGAVLGLVMQVVAVDVQGLWIVGSSDSWLHMARLGGMTAGPGKMSYLTDFLLSAVVAQWSLFIEGRAYGNGRWGLAALLVLCGLSVYFEAMRNEIFDLVVFAVFIGAIVYKVQFKRAPGRAILAVVGIIFLFSIVVGVDLAVDPRWGSLWATVPVALNTSHHLAWLNAQRFPLPRLPNGQVVSASNYLRIAWIKEGFKEIMAYPLGVGYGRAAFGHALWLRFGSLSKVIGLNDSLLTIAIGAGIPGVALWLGLFVSVGWFGISRLSGARAFEARFLFLIVLAFGVRMAVDNDMQNYTLEQFLYFLGLLMPLAIPETADCPAKGAVKDFLGNVESISGGGS